MNESENCNLLIVFGEQLSKDGKMPNDLIDRLNLVVDYIAKKPNSNVLLCGKYAEAYDREGFKPAHYEYQEMQKYLISQDVGKERIFLEKESKNTIENVLNVSKFLSNHIDYKKLTVVCAKHHQPRVSWLFSKYTRGFDIKYLTLDAKPSKAKLEFEKSLLDKYKKEL